MIRAAKIKVYARLMERRGVPVEQLLEGTTISPDLLVNPEGMVTRDMYYAVIMNMLKLSGDPAIAFSLGDIVEIATFGILGYAMLSSTTLGQVVRIRRQCQADVFATMVNIDAVKSVRPGFEMTVASTGLTETLHRFEIEEFVVEGMTLIKLLTGITPVMRSLSLAYGKPSYASRYEEFFQCPVRFDSPETVLGFQEPDLESPILSGNAELHAVCANHCHQVLRSRPGEGHLHDKLRELFLASPGALPEMREAAHALGMSERNLGRRLQSEGKTFQGLKDQFRLDLSHQLLVSGKMAQKEVAYLLGFTTPSGFSRAFKSWTGTTVQQFVRTRRELSSKRMPELNGLGLGARIFGNGRIDAKA